MVRSLRRSPGATGLRGGDPQHGARTMAASVHRKSKRCGAAWRVDCGRIRFGDR
jgi:hypothetical protein